MTSTKNKLKNMNFKEKVALAADPNTPLEVLEELAKTNEEGVRSSLVSNPNIPEKLLKVLSRDSSWGVRREVAANPKTPINLLKALAIDDVWGIRRKVAQNPNATEQILVKIWKYEKSHKNIEDILIALFSHSNCPDWLKAVIKTVLEWK
jgi:hypothetical protein